MNSYVQNKLKKIKRNYQVNQLNPKSLVAAAHYKILYADLDTNTGGCSITNSRCSTIIVNQEWDDSYINFVILHEFSHLKLHSGESTPFYREIGLNSFVPKMEYEANWMALHLLISMQDESEIDKLTKFQLMNYLGLPTNLAIFL